MNIFTRDDFNLLIERETPPYISIYLPTHRVTAESYQDPIRFKNLIRKAEKILATREDKSHDVEGLLTPAYRLLEDSHFWYNQGDGLAVFLSPGLFRYYRLPTVFDELLVVTNSFHTKPLLPMLYSNGAHFILALSKKGVRLFQCSRFSVRELDVVNTPEGLMETLKYDIAGRYSHIHTSKQGGDAVFMSHGAGMGRDEIKDKLDQYMRQVERGVTEVLKGQTAPLVLAGVEYLLAMYREVNSYPHLLEPWATGNPDRVSPEELQGEVWSIVEPLFQEERQAQAERYRALISKRDPRASRDMETILAAAFHGRVDVLFVALGVQAWGTFDPVSARATRNEHPQPGDEDLLDLAATQTILKGGTVYAVPLEEVPDETTLAALFRF